jgi:hypothetical protein
MKNSMIFFLLGLLLAAGCREREPLFPIIPDDPDPSRYIGNWTLDRTCETRVAGQWVDSHREKVVLSFRLPSPAEDTAFFAVDHPENWLEGHPFRRMMTDAGRQLMVLITEQGELKNGVYNFNDEYTGSFRNDTLELDRFTQDMVTETHCQFRIIPFVDTFQLNKACETVVGGNLITSSQELISLIVREVTEAENQAIDQFSNPSGWFDGFPYRRMLIDDGLESPVVISNSGLLKSAEADPHTHYLGQFYGDSLVLSFTAGSLGASTDCQYLYP